MESAEVIAAARLAAQHLVRPLATPGAVVEHLLAVQAQDFGGAKWAVGQRARGATDATVEAAFAAGALLRTHVMRPTWHFVAPADLRWLLALTAPRVHAVNSGPYKLTGFSARKLAATDTRLAKTLAGGGYLTRDELAKRLDLPPSGFPLSYVMMHAELEGAIVSGPRRGKQFTYAAFDERVPAAPAKPRDAALAELARRYVTSHGPAQIADLAWWSGLTKTAARRALALCGDVLVRHDIAGVTYFAAPVKRAAALADPTVHLLPNYDECLIAFADRTAAQDPRVVTLDAAVLANHFVLSAGRLIGGWRRVDEGKTVVVAATLLVKPTKPERVALAAEVERYGRFLGVPTRLA